MLVDWQPLALRVQAEMCKLGRRRDECPFRFRLTVNRAS